MFKLYNSYSQISSDLSKFFKNIFPTISKPHLKIIPDVILGMIISESVVTTDIIKKIKDPWSDVQSSSIERKFERFFNNNKFLSYNFYDSIIKHIIKNYKLKNNNVYISFDHMYCKDKFTIFLLSLRIGKQGISYVLSLFSDKKCNLIFLADRWFNFREIMQHIDSLGDTYCIRTKSNVSIEIDNYVDSDLIAFISDIEPRLSKSLYFDSVRITSFKFQTKLAVSKTVSHKEPFFILTNGNTRDAIKHYGYRFGSIELFVLLFFGLLFWGLTIQKIRIISKIALKLNILKEMAMAINVLFLYSIQDYSFLILLLNPQNILFSNVAFGYMISNFPGCILHIFLSHYIWSIFSGTFS